MVALAELAELEQEPQQSRQQVALAERVVLAAAAVEQAVLEQLAERVAPAALAFFIYITRREDEKFCGFIRD